jgi:hypothetical protein
MIKLILMRMDYDYDKNSTYSMELFRLYSCQLNSRAKLWPWNS